MLIDRAEIIKTINRLLNHVGVEIAHSLYAFFFFVASHFGLLLLSLKVYFLWCKNLLSLMNLMSHFTALFTNMRILKFKKSTDDCVFRCPQSS